MAKKQLKQLYSQNKIAQILGISRGTLSKWLKKNGVSPKQQKGQRKLYDETVIKQYKQSKESRNSAKNRESKRVTTVELLQNQLTDKQSEIDYLRQQLKDKDAQIKAKDKTISDFGNQFAKLADQAQQLNLADKPRIVQDNQSKNKQSTKTVTAKKAHEDTIHEEDTVASVSSTKKHWWQRLFD